MAERLFFLRLRLGVGGGEDDDFGVVGLLDEAGVVCAARAAGLEVPASIRVVSTRR